MHVNTCEQGYRNIFLLGEIMMMLQGANRAKLMLNRYRQAVRVDRNNKETVSRNYITRSYRALKRLYDENIVRGR